MNGEATDTLTHTGEAKEVGRLPGRDPASVRGRWPFCITGVGLFEEGAFRLIRLRSERPALSMAEARCPKTAVTRGEQAGSRPGSRVTSFASLYRPGT
jgi:hypothetical protein